MTLEQLAIKENELYSLVLDLYKREQTEELAEKLKTVYASCKQVHTHYSVMAKQQDEALKRGLFIQWYACTEPNYITGIEKLDEEAERNIIDLIEEKIQNNNLDNELEWMLNYYANWDYVFEKFKNRKGFIELIANRTDDFPIGLVIDKEEMNQRGQMGMYWNSLNHFAGTEKNASS
ncbi:MAG: hypothetical protein EOP48_34510 [Sphingobacteriales bacterium]|nr:MAG: hypothetical protein EOP48_34510 [Sphingobacteriales bacterium]